MMLKDESIIYFGPEPWAGLWRNRHQLMSRFAMHNDVWYVEPPTLLRQLIRGKKQRTRLFSRDPSGVNVFHSPWWLPVIGRAPLKNPSIGMYLQALKFLAGGSRRKHIVWLSRPPMIDYVGRLQEKLTIYHVVDEYSGYGSATENERQKLLGMERKLLERVDAAIVVTPSLHKLKSLHNSNTHIVPNAADFSAYAHTPEYMPVDLDGIQRPIIGYTGLIASRLDLDLLSATASAKPTWSFVFVGSVNDEGCRMQLDKLKQLSNVYFVGQKSVAETPNYVGHFDICTIPYAVNLRAQHASPLKLYEYAAASKPIVATDFAAARDFGGHVDVVRNAAEFIDACERGLKLNSQSRTIKDNLDFAAKNTWDERVEQVSEIIASSMQRP